MRNFDMKMCNLLFAAQKGGIFPLEFRSMKYGEETEFLVLIALKKENKS